MMREWAHISVDGASDGRQRMQDDNRDLCQNCRTPLHTLMTTAH
jgi:hypothetical protein